MRILRHPTALCLLQLLAGFASLAFGGDLVRTTRSGPWEDPLTWAKGRVPLPEEWVLIVSGHSIVFNRPPDPQDECARLIIPRGAGLTFGPAAVTFQVGGSGAVSAGGVFVFGSLVIPAGMTLEIDPDGNASMAQ